MIAAAMFPEFGVPVMTAVLNDGAAAAGEVVMTLSATVDACRYSQVAESWYWETVVVLAMAAAALRTRAYAPAAEAETSMVEQTPSLAIESHSLEARSQVAAVPVPAAAAD